MKEIKNSNNEINYLLYLPKNVEENMPVLLYLHGIGERGINLEDVKKFGMPKYLNDIEIPYIIICPQCLQNNFWDYHLREVEIVLSDVIEKYNADKDNVCILGSSMGAFASWNYIMQRPNLFTSLISVAGGAMLPIGSNVELIKDKNILIYHGDSDDIISCEKSIEIYNALKNKNAKNVELKIIKNDNHYLSTHAFEDPYLYEWLDNNLRKKQE